MIKGELSHPPSRFFLFVPLGFFWECWGLNYEVASECFGDVNCEGGARWGSGSVSAGSARMVMKVEQDGALGGHLCVDN
ncbi:hypothetical protein V6N11_062029 [Hibiscus sabdariffa]|uniref:Uncharacterized protein n=1 Tax=Hibiscus sabdariffa TaxID=183260 RepID=A0ABR2PRF5_9ROSI